MSADRTEMGEFRERFDWRQVIREHRRRKKLSQPDLARRSGLSLSAVKAYESGSRHPSRETLVAIIDALGMTAGEANPVLAGAGYATNWRAIFHQAYGPRDIDWFTEEVERSPWPVFVTNEASDIIAANRALRLLHDMPLSEQLPRPEKWNSLALASQPWYAERLENWDEAMGFVLGMAKTDLREQVNPERPPTWAAEPYKRFLQGDPALVTRMLKAWEPAEPVAHTTRIHYRVRWRLGTGELMRFAGIIHVADIWQVFAWHDWIPEDSETLTLLERLKSSISP
jgi:transcriptional regulator with XRE-family HTH domain